MKTTFSRTLFALAVILSAAMLLVGLSFQILVKNYMEDRAMENLKNDATVLSDIAAAYYDGHSLANRELLINLSVISAVSGSDTVICDADGRLVLCSEDPMGCSHQGLMIGADYLRQVKASDYVMNSGMIRGLYEDARYVVSVPIRDGSRQIIGIVIASTPMAETLAVLKRLSDTFLFVALLVIAICAVVITVYARKHSSPLRDLAKAATAFGHGDLKARVKLSSGSPKEVQELALAFNNMAVSLEKSEYQRQEFVANVSHELKTPMTTIGGYIDGMLDGTIPPEQQEHYLQIVSGETKRLSRLVRSMLDISRLQEQGGIPEEQKSRFDISEAIGQVIITFEQKILAKSLNVEVDLPDYPLYTMAHKDHIHQVIYNLVDNGVKFCPEGGVLGIKLRQSGGKAYVSISNEGPTIPAEELPLLFDRFHKLDKSRSQNRDGWGLGLYIVKTIICSHGEDLSVTSREGVTEFTFTLPVIH